VEHSVRLDGTQHRLLSGATLPFAPCSGDVTVLRAGSHVLRSGSPLLPDSVELATADRVPPPPAEAPLPFVHGAPRGGGGFDVEVQNAQGPYYLVIGQNIAPGWRASIAGDDLGPPLVLDGYSAGWYVPRTGSYHVLVTYRPQAGYRLAVAVSVVATMVAVVLVAAELARRRRVRR
jgi:arabinofuranan 3-O-arabinosyltransferase